MAQNIPPTPQAEFAALGFYGEPLDQMIHRSFEEQNQGLANAHGFKMISPYIDPSGARMIRFMGDKNSTVAVSLMHPETTAARVGLITPTVALVDVLNTEGEIAARVTCAVDDFFSYSTVSGPEVVKEGKVAANADEDGMIPLVNFCLTAALGGGKMHLYPSESAWRQAHPEHVREDGVITKSRLISPAAQAFFDGDTDAINPWNHVRITVAGIRGATNELTGKQFFVVQDTPNARGFALTACLPATEELKKHMRPGVVLEGPAVLMGHNATLANPAVSAPEDD